jgi:hypothetical protein
VSEYQYYDFRALDRPLTRNEMATLRSISTRAAITATEWGDLKANPSKLLEKYFDAFAYDASWGTREFHIHFRRDRSTTSCSKSWYQASPTGYKKPGHS